jgi:hypothetical protein
LVDLGFEGNSAWDIVDGWRSQNGQEVQGRSGGGPYEWREGEDENGGGYDDEDEYEVDVEVDENKLVGEEELLEHENLIDL